LFFFLTTDQAIAISVLLSALVLFVWGKWRYDLVALAALLACVLTGILPVDKAFLGFSHPAVIMTACILVLTKSLSNSGILDNTIYHLYNLTKIQFMRTLILVFGVGISSAFMNNIGALSLVLPIAIQYCKMEKIAPSKLLMPLSFASLLGGLMTMIGTPPNIIIASYRGNLTGQSFQMFDFIYVGGIVGVVGMMFVGLIGYKFLPKRVTALADDDPMKIGEYMTEVALTKNSELIGKTVAHIVSGIDEQITVLAIIRGRRRIECPEKNEILLSKDIIILEGAPENLKILLDRRPVRVLTHEEQEAQEMYVPGVQIMEIIVPPGASVIGSTGQHFFKRFGSVLLAIGRSSGEFVINRLSKVQFAIGDVLLVQGKKEDLQQTLSSTGCFPLAGRDLIPVKGKILLQPFIIFVLAISLTIFDILPSAFAFLLAVTALLFWRKLTPTEAYRAIDMSVLILIAAFIPVGQAFTETGAASLVVNSLLKHQGVSHYVIIATLLATTMLLSDLINNAATAVLMAPIAVEVANNLGVSVDPFLMTVAIGSSCTFLTPIGHPSNTIVMGAANYKFQDYWRMGLPLDIIIILICVPLIPVIWPL
jgi:di/tricarboxylate transporter